MRVPVQRHLILWLCLFLFPAFTQAATQPSRSYVANTNSSPINWCSGADECTVIPYERIFNDGHSEQWSALFTCPTNPKLYLHYSGTTTTMTAGNYSYQQPSGGTCETDEPAPPPKTPEQCSETGKLFDPQTKQCVTECDNGMFNGSCLMPPEDNSDCNKDSPDYRGEVVLGYGKSPIPACGDFDQCSGDTAGQVGVFNGELRCLPEDYGIPKCQGDSITVIDDYGFVCEPLSDTPEEPPTPEEPNTDTDGDGTPDEYQRQNDPESVDKGLDNINKGIGEGNTKLDGVNDRLDKVGKGIQGINENLNEGLGTANQTLGQIRDKMDGPDGGYNTDGLGDAPTFEATSTRLQDLIRQNPTIQAVTTIPSIAQNNTCPVWTIPATDFWDATPMDIHCDILNQYRSLFSALFMAVWTLAAVFVFLRA